MRKFMSVITMILVLLSSGAAQMAYHICDEDGVHIWADDCATEVSENEQPKDNCCSKKNVCETSHKIAVACCTEAYFFSLLPLPVSLIKFKLEKTIPWDFPAWIGLSYVSQLFSVGQQSVVSARQHPPDNLPCRPNQSALCIWII